MLQRFGSGQIQAIYAHDDEMALGAVEAAEAAGRAKEITIVGIDGENSAFQAVKDGKIAATFKIFGIASSGEGLSPGRFLRA